MNGAAPWHSRLPRPLRNPYVLGFLVGVVLVTLSVPLFRRVPPAPAPIGDMPAWSLVDRGGQPIGSRSLAGRTFVVALASGRCTGSCARTSRSLSDLAARFAAVSVDVPVVVVDVGDAEGPPADAAGSGALMAARGSAGESCALAQGSFAKVRGLRVPCEQIHQLAHDPHALIVDGLGRIRASIRLDGAGLDEIFHRSLAVFEGRRMARGGRLDGSL